MKKVAILLSLTILAISLVSASYECSNGTIEEDTESINLGEVRFPNKIGVGIIGASEGGRSADFLVDSKSTILTNATSSVEVELLTGTYDIDLINITGNVAWIKVNGNKGEISREEVRTVGSLQVYMTSVSGEYPGDTAEVKLMVGIENQFLYYNQLTSTKTIKGTEYLFELFSSSTNDATITVKKCKDGKLVEIADTPTENPTPNITTPNATINTTSNITINTTQHNTSNQLQNTTQNSEISNTTTGNFFSNNLILIIIIGVISIILVIILIFFLKKNSVDSPQDDLEPIS